MFDTIITVDWSAASRPVLGANSIWTCATSIASSHSQLDNHATRHAATAHLGSLLAARGGSTLLAFDVALGYPSGFAERLGIRRAPRWQGVCELIASHLHDRPDNRNDRFAVAARLNALVGPGPGPFWGTTSDAHTDATLSRTKAPGFPHRCASGGPTLDEWRLAERVLRSMRRRPASVWQLAGAGSVGSQTLTAVPMLAALRSDPRLAGRVVIWPFDTGLVSDPTGGRRDAIVIAEAWPSLVTVDLSRHPVRDAAQVVALAEHLRALDTADALGALFAPALASHEVAIVVDEEGWILGTPGTA